MAGIAQLVEPRIVIPVVAGSNPVSRPTTSFQNIDKFMKSLFLLTIYSFLPTLVHAQVESESHRGFSITALIGSIFFIAILVFIFKQFNKVRKQRDQ